MKEEKFKFYTEMLLRSSPVRTMKGRTATTLVDAGADNNGILKKECHRKFFSTFIGKLCCKQQLRWEDKNKESEYLVER